MRKASLYLSAILCAVISCCTLSSCDDDKSYADLLNDENKAVNRYLVDQRVVDEIPADSNFIVGPNAPYYKLDEDGNVYMQVLDKGSDKKPKAGDRVYFRYTRYNLFTYEPGKQMEGSGNADNLNPSVGGPTYFFFDNFNSEASITFGAGIQQPMRFLGYDAKVNIVVKSQYGMTAEMTSVVPFLYTISYYKPMI